MIYYDSKLNFFYWISPLKIYKSSKNNTLKSQAEKEVTHPLEEPCRWWIKSVSCSWRRPSSSLVWCSDVWKQQQSVDTGSTVVWVEAGEQQQVLCVQAPARTSTYTPPVGDIMTAPPTSCALVCLCRTVVVAQHTHTPPALLAFQRWP